MIERIGAESTLFEDMTPRQKIIAASLKLPLDGSGSTLGELLVREDDDGPYAWTPAQNEAIALAGDVLSKLIKDMKEEHDSITSFHYEACIGGKITTPAQIAHVEIRRRETFQEVAIDIDHDYSHPDCRDIGVVIQGVEANTIAIGKLTFETEDDEWETEDHVAWPIAEQDGYLTALFHRLSGESTSPQEK
jgi:hypothetical protein